MSTASAIPSSRLDLVTSQLGIHQQISLTDAFRNGAKALIVLSAGMPAMVTTSLYIVSPLHQETV